MPFYTMLTLSWASSTYSGIEFQECSTQGMLEASELEPKPTVVSNMYAYKYLKKQSSKGGISISALSRTVQATGLSRTMIIVQTVGNKRRLQENVDFPTPTKRYLSSRKCILSDDFDWQAIR